MEIVRFEKDREPVELGLAPDLAAGVRGRAHHDGARPRRDGALERLEVDVPRGRTGGDEHGREPEQERRVEVVAVVRLEEDDLVARVEERHQGRGVPARGARGDDDLARRVVVEAVAPQDLVVDAGAERGDALGRGVDDLVPRDGVTRGIGDRGRGGEIADALPHVDPVHRFADAAHPTNVRDHQRAEALSELHGSDTIARRVPVARLLALARRRRTTRCSARRQTLRREDC